MPSVASSMKAAMVALSGLGVVGLAFTGLTAAEPSLEPIVQSGYRCGGHAPEERLCGFISDGDDLRLGPVRMGRVTPWASASDFTGVVIVTAETWPDPWIQAYEVRCNFVEGFGTCGPPTTQRAFFDSSHFVWLRAHAIGQGNWTAYFAHLLCGPGEPCL